jgi:hypothetical protein
MFLPIKYTIQIYMQLENTLHIKHIEYTIQV